MLAVNPKNGKKQVDYYKLYLIFFPIKVGAIEIDK